MLGIRRIKDTKWFNWFAAWFELLEYLFRVLTLGFYDLDLSGTWLCFPSVTIKRQYYYGIGNHIKWWIIAWIRVLELLLVILTLCYFRFYWCDAFFLFADKLLYKEE